MAILYLTKKTILFVELDASRFKTTYRVPLSQAEAIDREIRKVIDKFKKKRSSVKLKR